MAVFLQDDTGKGPATHDKDGLVVLLQFFNERYEVAVASNDHKCVDMTARKRHFQRIADMLDGKNIRGVITFD